MIIVAGGDSFVWGSELQDSPHDGPMGYSRSTYSALLAKHAGLEYVCSAYLGTEKYETCAPRGFYQWKVENKYKVGRQGYPSEDAHRDAATLIKEKFNELVNQHNQQN